MSGEVPEGWKSCPLAELSDLQPGFAFKSDKFADTTEIGLPLIRIRDLQNQTPEKFIDDEVPQAFVVHDGDILVGMDGEFRCVTWRGGPAALNQRVLRVFNTLKSNKSWLHYRLTPILAELESKISGTTVKHLSTKDLKNIQVATPPLPEQQRIAEILSSVDESIRATEAVIAQAERVKRGLMEDLLTGGLGSAAVANGEVPEEWAVTSLKKITTKIGSGVTPKGGKQAYLSSGIPLIRSQNVGWGNLMLEDVAFIDEQQHEKMSGSKVKCGDVLLNITGASIGRSAVYFGDDFGANVNQHVCIIRPQADVDPIYINYFLLSHIGLSQVDAFQAGGNREGLNFQQIGSFRVSLPSLPEQRRIVAVLNSVNDQITTNRATVEQLQRLKRGLMDDLLTGKVRAVS